MAKRDIQNRIENKVYSIIKYKLQHNMEINEYIQATKNKKFISYTNPINQITRLQQIDKLFDTCNSHKIPTNCFMK